MIEKVYAATSGQPLGRIGGEGGLGPFGNISLDPTSGLTAITKIVSSVIGVMTVAAGIWFIFQFIIGGFSWMTAGGDKGKLQEAQHRLTNAIIGFIIVVGGWAILALIGQFVGLDILINDPGKTIEQINIGS